MTCDVARSTILLTAWLILTATTVAAQEASRRRIPSWFVDTDIVLIGERIDGQGSDNKLAITEILKASKPVALSALPLSAVGTSSRRVLLLINIPRVDKNPGANPTIGMTVRQLPIFDDAVTVVSAEHQARRYSLLELRIALVFEESTK